MKIFRLSIIVIVTLTFFYACTPSTSTDSAPQESEKFSIDFEKYTLENGLQVILHQDKSDPIVALAVQYHVGSGREVVGRTGFAHLFEHMLFQESENVPQDQFFKYVQDAGGTLNGFTTTDGTVYYEIVPKNAMERVMWLESDRMGFFINTVTEAAFMNQQQVVQNEKRQRVDNTPYGHNYYVIHKNLFPEGHPYNWQVIGELEDLMNATVEDVKEFYRNFYGPNNATLVLAGDFETEDAKAMIEKYFGEIKKGKDVSKMKPQPGTLEETKKRFHEDNFAKAPKLSMAWPTVEEYHEDAYALNVLGNILSDGKKAPFYKELVKKKELTSGVYAWNRTMELAGYFMVSVTANDGVDLDSIETSIFIAMENFEKEGIKDKDIERVKAGLETEFYGGIVSIISKAFQLSMYNTSTGDPAFIEQDIANMKAVTKEDVIRVYEKYIKGKPFVSTSFVPQGQMDLIVEGSQQAKVVEEEVTEIAQQEAETKEVKEVEKTPSKFDRSVTPELGESPKVNIPSPWTAELSNGMKVYGIQTNEVPLVEFGIVIEGGMLLEDIEKVGVSNLVGRMMKEGTKNKTPEELEEEIDLLGSYIGTYGSTASMGVNASCLTRNFEQTVALASEILLEPRWDEEEFDRIKTSIINGIKRKAGSPGAIASSVYKKLLYGESSLISKDLTGTEESVNAITIDDLKSYYKNNFSPSMATLVVVGAISKEEVLAAFKSIEQKWEAKDVTIPELQLAATPDDATLYFVDFPGAKQSVVRIGCPSLKHNHPDYQAVQVMNLKLGGSFNSRLNLILREEKGYTYGARSGFNGGKRTGSFSASADVQTNATLESVQIFREEMEKYKEGIDEEELQFTKNSMLKSRAMDFETLGDLYGTLSKMAEYDLTIDYIQKEDEVVRNMTLDAHKALAEKYITQNKMIYLVVGDAATQLEKLKSAGFDNVVLLDKDGNVVMP